MPFQNCKSGKLHRMCKCALCTVDDESCFSTLRLGPKTSVCEKYVSIKSTVTSCDVTNCAITKHGFKKHASSRREAVSDSRGVPRCTEKNFQKSTLAHMCRSFDSSNPSYSYPVTRTVTRHHCTSCQVSSSQSALFPYQASISTCGIVHVPALSSQYHLDSHQS